MASGGTPTKIFDDHFILLEYRRKHYPDWIIVQEIICAKGICLVLKSTDGMQKQTLWIIPKKPTGRGLSAVVRPECIKE